ncbi:MAG: sigma-70 family RNA polymerase sigma factor [Thermoguttaceae bacterium]|nr:sigma-70 family RNA polymerase sigma factor [Thermoguttaceae bacterium]
MVKSIAKQIKRAEWEFANVRRERNASGFEEKIDDLRESSNGTVAASRSEFSRKDESMKEEIYREFCRGVSIKELAQKFGRAVASIYRAVGARRAEEIFALPLEYVPSAEFERATTANAERAFLVFDASKEPKATTGAETSAIGVSDDASGASDASGAAKKNGKLRAAATVESAYLSRLDDSPLLSAAEEAFLFRKFNFLKFKAARLRETLDPKKPKMSVMDEIERLWNEAIATKQRLISANLRLVVSVVKKYGAGSLLSFNELVSDGNVSLMKAVEKFDYTTGNRFSTYATWALYRNFARTIPDERKRVERFRPGDVSLLELKQDHRSSPLQAERAYAEQTSQVRRFMRELNDRERKIVEMRYGFGAADSKPQTLRQVGKNMGVTKERVRQIELRALEKLRRIAEEEKMEIPEFY